MTGIRFAGFMALLALAGSSSAAPITWEFEGIVRYADLGDGSALGGSLGVSVGASAFGRVVYESTTPESGAGSGTYPGAVSAFEVTIGSYTVGALEPSPFNAFYVRLEPGPGPFDLEFANGLPAPDALFPSIPILTLGLIADTPGIFPDSSLPTAPAALSALRSFSIDDWLTGPGFGTGLQIYRGGPSDQEQVLVEFTRLEAVPEPATFALLAPLALAFAAIGRRKNP